MHVDSEDDDVPSVHIDFALTARVMTASVVFEILGMVLIVFIVLLSISRQSASQVNAVPRIFTVNLMLVNLVHSLAAFISDYSMVNRNFVVWLDKLAVYAAIWTSSLDVQRTSVLVFCSSFVPMMLVTIAACFHNSRFTKISSPLWFIVVVLVSDAVPILFQVLNLSMFAEVGGFFNWQYVAFGVFLYITQMALTGVALWLLYRRVSRISKTAATDKFQRNLRRFLMFSAAPNLLLILFVLSQLSQLVRFNSQFLADVSEVFFHIQKIVLAIKPTIDALSTLLFLGEYRQHLGAASLWLGRWLVSKGQSMAPPTVSVGPTRSASLVVSQGVPGPQRKLSNISTRSAWN